MTSNFIDQFGFNEEEFAEQEDKIDAPFSEKISSIDFNIQANQETQPGATMFEQACSEKIQQFDDNDSDEEIWEEKAIVYDKNVQQKRPGRLPETRRSPSSDEDSTDSEDELDSPQRIQQQPTEKMDIDSNEGWVANFDDVAMEAGPDDMETGTPWEQGQQAEKWSAEFSKKNSSDEENWADFSKFSSVVSTQFTSAQKGPRSSSPVAMDTSENTRSNAYLVQSASADLETEVQTASKDLKLSDVECETPQKEVNPPSPGGEKADDKASEESAKTSVENDETSKKTDLPSSTDNPPSCQEQSTEKSFLASSGLIKLNQHLQQSPKSTANDEVAEETSAAEEAPDDPIVDKVDSKSTAKEGAEKIEIPVVEGPIPNGPV